MRASSFHYTPFSVLMLWTSRLLALILRDYHSHKGTHVSIEMSNIDRTTSSVSLTTNMCVNGQHL